MISTILCALLSFGTIANAQSTDAHLSGAVALAALSPNPPYVGLFVDPITNVTFELYDRRASSDPSTAFDAYLEALNTTPAPSRLQRRGWWDCEQLNDIQKACCNTGHAIGRLARDVGTSALGTFITAKVNTAFSNGRGAEEPRSVCSVYNTQSGANNLCVSWTNYNAKSLRNGESGDIGGFAAACGSQNGSAEFKATTSDGGVIFICVSDRASGCQNPGW